MRVVEPRGFVKLWAAALAGLALVLAGSGDV